MKALVIFTGAYTHILYVFFALCMLKDTRIHLLLYIITMHFWRALSHTEMRIRNVIGQ